MPPLGIFDPKALNLGWWRHHLQTFGWFHRRLLQIVGPPAPGAEGIYRITYRIRRR